MAVKKKTSFYIQWHITDKCNLRCTHCYVKDKKKDLDIELLKKGIKNVLTPVSNWVDEIDICFSGGEPFFSPNLLELIKYLRSWKKVKKIMFTSNGTIVNLDILNKIKNDVDNIQISLEGGTDINDSIRGRGVFDSVKKNIPVFKALGWKVGINMTIHKLNYKEIPQVIDFCNENKVDVFAVTRLVPTGLNKRGLGKMLLSKDEIKEVYSTLLSLSRINKKIYFSFDRTLWNCLDKKIGRACSVGINGVAILADGTILPCRRLQLPLGNFLKDSFSSIWFNSDILNKLRKRSNIKGCGSCEHSEDCSGCRAIAYEVEGDFLAKDPQCFL